ncbi:glycerol dehydrogenase [Natranaerobius thermophilus]|uniref:Glycerol dehydrogenase n=1 Tax=Natranaerobius thermophilus (strain ATCC BAA-1301 / DSM 18059 / JW/NM-WN-LF) TaxID=457570 RepID=B2A2F4_NATTJ|nr:glycerol dehydrogenase [Natranaerobius thermophilus]ACB86260.1 iron-containing alcohol dehydrogenase [Natranaerobius thermophilus JW/NM-WN-LF]
MEKLLIAPSKYVQGPGVTKTLGEYAENYGQKALIIGGNTALKASQTNITDSLKEHHVDSEVVTFSGKCTEKEIDDLQDKFAEVGADFIIGVGGGKVIDTAKAVAHYKDVPMIIVPTIAATDAPCSALSVVYTEEGAVDEYLFLKQNPDVVMVDTDIIKQAPVRLFVAGIGDALATYFEARACYQNNADSVAGKKATRTALALSELCYEILEEHGENSVTALNNNALTPAVEQVTEANILLSGLGFESTGVAAAHGIHDGLTVLEETKEAYHGEKVAIGTLAQLVLEGATEELDQVLKLCYSVGLPTTLKEIGIETVDEQRLLKVGEASCAEGSMIHNMPFEVTPEMVKDALLTVNGLGEEVDIYID